jgi:hypothetical protein
MVFESRNLTPYAEPVEASTLKTGTVYFFLNYTDSEMLIPTLEPMVFVGRNLEPSDREQVYFQDLDSYQQGIRYESASSESEATFSAGSETEINHVFEYEHALDELMRCSLRRKKAP